VGKDDADRIEKVSKISFLTEKLSHARGLDVAGEATKDPAEAVLAYSFVEIEGECRAFTDEYLPSLMNATSTTELEDALNELLIGLRHLGYHLKDSPYLRQQVLGFD
jgi:hypothetical protein